MPERLLIPARWLMHHVQEHPARLIATAIAVLLSSLALLGVALYANFAANKRESDRAHEAAVANCVAINELRRQIYIAALDLNLDPIIAARFIPDQDCEVLP